MIAIDYGEEEDFSDGGNSERSGLQVWIIMHASTARGAEDGTSQVRRRCLRRGSSGFLRWREPQVALIVGPGFAGLVSPVEAKL